MVIKAWDDTNGGYDFISDRLVAYGEVFKEWSDEKFGSINKKAKKLREQFQSLYEADPIAETLHKLREIETKLLPADRFQEIFWAQRAHHESIVKGTVIQPIFIQELNNVGRRISSGCFMMGKGELI